MIAEPRLGAVEREDVCNHGRVRPRRSGTTSPRPFRRTRRAGSRLRGFGRHRRPERSNRGVSCARTGSQRFSVGVASMAAPRQDDSALAVLVATRRGSSGVPISITPAVRNALDARQKASRAVSLRPAVSSDSARASSTRAAAHQDRASSTGSCRRRVPPSQHSCRCRRHRRAQTRRSAAARHRAARLSVAVASLGVRGEVPLPARFPIPLSISACSPKVVAHPAGTSC